MSKKHLIIHCDDLTNAKHLLQDQYGNTWAEIKDGATHIVAVSELQKLIEQTTNVFELTIKTIAHSSKDCLVTFKKI